MKQEIEIELKNLVTNDEFSQLIHHFSIPENSFKNQTNYYFDTNNFDLKQNHCALRIRRKSNTYTLTLKEPYEEGLLESHESLTKENALQLIDGKAFSSSEILKHIESKYGISKLSIEYLGSLETKRSEYPYKSGLLVLDHSKYLGKEDYELEFEVPERTQGEMEFNDLLKTFSIPQRKTPNKIQRFFDYKKSNT
ncbi:CYTH domain-containing protein [Pseudalkalibacillus berkeleyi]|uniref:CYTH domain-containing protein n=1 Tax=Pseudalkalibacillus berkeleyi TaxID=1069813 RepID=A0ABS9GZ39_9BACL|nr:CYTH domain-containing protein [Pseudalkalibacillus berkeleyi]MCF6136863.1 CYTH domain-containing protein [Pseudalkalibacillus berkeleyi]